MSADFWSGYAAGAVGIAIGNPLDLIKTRLQAGDTSITAAHSWKQPFGRLGDLVKGITAPILGYGALNALLFVTYNRTLLLLGQQPELPASAGKAFAAGTLGGLATFIVSAPTELVKCRTQVSAEPKTSFTIAKELWKEGRVRALYWGGGVTSMRDAIGYGFYFWSYELSKKSLSSKDDTDKQAALKILLCGGLAGVVTWTSIFPLDVIKTRVQTQQLTQPPTLAPERRLLIHPTTQQNPDNMPTTASQTNANLPRKLGAIEIAKHAYRTEGLPVFFRGLGICSVRAFIVNAVQWAVYEYLMQVFRH
ncbi:hypothetical protein LTR66_002086 [Elasticomyces elasticus]|nr:hypothetical protein LTR66_002086 [Elasticomyces elasticus]